MNEQAKKIWNSPQGVSLFKNMLEGKQPDQQDRKTLDQLKRADPPKMQQGNETSEPATPQSPKTSY